MNRDVFNVELNRLINSNVRESTEAVLDMIPDYFYEIPASSSGKYHPAFSLGEGGLVRHVKVAIRVPEELFRDTAFGEYDDYTKDLIRIEENGRIKESISFPAFKYKELINQNWEDSDLREQLETTKYMFFVFEKIKGEYIFKGIKLWNMPETDIETSVMEMWKKTYNAISTGNIVKSITNGIRKTNFPGMSENEVCHVRPHGRNAKDTAHLPVADKLTGATRYTKHCFWINNKYIKKMFVEFN